MRIDIHSHLLSERAFEGLDGEAKKFRPRIVQESTGELFMLIRDHKYGPIPSRLLDVQERIQDMDKEGVDIQAVSAVPFTLFHEIQDDLANAICQCQNNFLAEAVVRNRRRLVGIACVPLQNVDMAIQELERSIQDLGLKGVEIGSNIGGKYLDSLRLWPFFEKVEQLDVPVIVHPINVAGEERMTKYYLSNLIGNPVDTSLAIASVIFGGALECFPRLKFCFLHGGGFIPYQRGRLEHGYNVRREPKLLVKKPPSEYIKMMYFDTITHYAPALMYLISTCGADRVVLGSDYPYDMGDPHPVSSVQALNGILPEDKEKILGKNAAKLLKIAI
jgi:aminocarboxymuconate-semialdehyde decarboxylase